MDEVFFLERNKKINAVHKTQIDICICVHNALNSVKNCLNSVIKNINTNYHKLIIIDDNSNYETQYYLDTIQKKYPSFVLLKRNNSTKGYSKSANYAKSLSNSEITILLNSDTIVTNGWTEKLALALKECNGAGIVSPLSNAASYQSLPSIYNTENNTAINKLPQSMTPEDMNKFCEMWSINGYYPRVPLVHGFCIALSKKIHKATSWF